MKCPVCQAKLLPVDGEMFCLQCGQTLHEHADIDSDNLRLEDTVDPMLQRAIRDAGNYEAQFMAAVPEEPAVEAKPAKRAVKIAKREEETPEQTGTLAEAEPVRPPKRSFVSLHAIVMAPRGVTPSGTLFVGTAPQVESPVAAPGERREFVRVKSGGKRHAVRGWLAGAAVIAVFAGLNIGVSNYYADRVYPGVKVGNVEVGGWTFAELSSRLPGVLQQPKLVANVNGHDYPLDVARAATVSQEAVERQVKELGRQTPLPAAGIVQAWLAAPVKPTYSLSDDALDRAVAQLSSRVDRNASNAFITTSGSSVLVVADKPGEKLDQAAAAAAIKSAYGAASTVTLNTQKMPAEVTAAGFEADKAAAEGIINQTLQLNVRKAHYTPTAAQLASWIIFNGPGKGVKIDPQGPAAFVAAIPGSFDRAAAVTALSTVLAAHKTAALTASTKRITAGPKVAAAAVVAPTVSYKYCVQANLSDSGALKEAAAKALGPGGGWTFGGRVSYEAADSGCNMKLQIADAAQLMQLDSACAGQSTCRIHNDLAINTANWAAVPSDWKGDLSSYRTELINHVVGQWLGFDHSKCQAAAAPETVSQVTVNVSGCSPNWHPVPVELQDTKVLAGF